jgi:serine/threonine-protein kinase RsbW
LSGRKAELATIFAAARLGGAGGALPLLLTGAPGIGKSSLLQTAARTLNDPTTGIVPLYAPLGRSAEPVASLAAALLGLADEAGSGEFGRLEALGRSRAGNARGCPASLAVDLLARPRDAAGVPRWDALAGLCGEVAGELGRRLLLLLDDIHRLPHPEALVAAMGGGRGQVAWIAASARNLTPKRGSAGSPPRTIRLEPLDDAAAWEMLRRLGTATGCAFGEECRAALPLWGGVPGLLSLLPAAAVLAGHRAFDSAAAMIDFHAHQATAGYLRDQYRALLGGDGEAGRLAIEFLIDLRRRGGRVPRREVAATLIRGERDAERTAKRLVSLGIVREEMGILLLDPCRPLDDFCRTRWRLRIEGRPEGECLARLRLESAAFLTDHHARATRRGNVSEFRSFLASWENQGVPRSLVDAGRFHELFPAEPPEGAAIADRDTTRVILPRIASSWEHDSPGGPGMPPVRLDLLAVTAPETGGDPRWLAVDLSLEAAEVTSAMVEEFARRMRLFAERDGIAPGSLTGWLVTGGSFSAEARQAAFREGIWTSGPGQLRLMAGATGGAVSLRLPNEAGAPKEPLALRMTIPASADIELVAARTLEEFGARLPFREGDLSRLKMALVEACINALEHGESEEHAVSLTFRVVPGALEIDVGNRGRAFVPATVSMPAVEEKFGAVRKRGWGLALIRELVDEMTFLEQDGGTCLRMTKHFATESPGHDRKEKQDARTDHDGHR